MGNASALRYVAVLAAYLGGATACYAQQPYLADLEACARLRIEATAALPEPADTLATAAVHSDACADKRKEAFIFGVRTYGNIDRDITGMQNRLIAYAVERRLANFRPTKTAPVSR